MPLSDSRFGRAPPEELEVRALRREERQRVVVQHDVDDDGAVFPALGAAHRALGVQHAPLFCAERGGLAEDVPLAGRLVTVLVDGAVLGEVQGEPADQTARVP